MHSVTTEVVIVVLLILVNGVFALAELALVAARKSRLRARAERGDRAAQIALRLAEQPERFLSTIQVGITLVGVATGAFAGATIAQKMAETFRHVPLLAGREEAVSIGIVVIGITYLSLVLGELVPKHLALRAPESVARAVAAPLRILSVACAPLVWLLGLSSRGVLALFRLRPTDVYRVTEEDVRLVLREGTESGVLRPMEGEILQRAARLDELKAARLMTRRPEIVWLDVTANWEENDRRIEGNPHSYFPVCEGDLDNVIGIVGVRDLYEHRVQGRKPDLRTLVREAIYVPDNITVLRLLENFKSSRAGLALVLDEFGSVEGLITLNDILEAMVGDLPSVTDVSDWFRTREDGTWLVDGLMPLEELAERIGVPREVFGEHDVETIGGLARRRLEESPRVGECFTLFGLRVEVVDMDGPRVDKVLISRKPEEGTA